MPRVTNPRAPGARKRPATASATDGTTADRVAGVLVEHIRKHRLPVGAELPSEVRTSVALRVSRSIIREAYRSLRSAGIVEVANGRSPRVGHLTPRAITQVLQHALSTDQASARDILELRAPIEERAAELAARRMQAPSDIADLGRALDMMKSAGQHAERYVRGDLAFHEAIARATGNALFSLLGAALREATSLSMRAGLRARRSPREILQVIATHEAVAGAIADGRPRLAKRFMVKHFAEARTAVTRFMAEEDARKTVPVKIGRRRPRA